MHHLIARRGLPVLLLLMAVAVILILSGAAAVGFAFGLVVAGMAGIVVVSSAIHDVARSESQQRRGSSYLYRGPSR